MTQEDKISFAQFHDEIDNNSFMGRPSKSNSAVPHNALHDARALRDHLTSLD